MYGTQTLQQAQAWPTFQTVTPLYQKAAVRGKLQKLIAALTGKSSDLADLSSLIGHKTVIGQRRLGSMVVRISQVVASEDRSGDFDRQFNPLQAHTRDRWLSIAAARLAGVSMPAVELIQVGDAYAVRDGHHRISVARALGEDYIDAQVIVWDLES